MYSICYMLTDHKLQVYLPKDLASKVRSRAKREGKTIAQVVREGLKLYLSRRTPDPIEEGYRRLRRLAGAFRDDGAGAAERHDEFLGSEGRW